METASVIWRIEMLGGLRARCGGRVLEKFQTRKTEALLAFLTCFPGRRFPREEVIAHLWPDAEPEAGRNRLSQALGWLRPHLEAGGIARGSVLLTDRQSVAIDAATVTTDIAEFEAALRAAESSKDAVTEIAALESAATLYQGDFLPGHYDDWILAERQRLLERFLWALRRMAAHYERHEAWDPALACARRALAVDPLSENAHCDLIRLLVVSGQADAARRQYRELERILEKELGEAPSPAARALLDRIQHTPAAPHKATAPLPPVDIPTPLTRFFGREREIDQVEAIVKDEGVRLITLIGTGGAGKTRLAIELARRFAARTQDIVCFVPLMDVRDAQAIPDAVADVLRLPRSPSADSLDQVAQALSSRPSLMVLDNLEHLPSAPEIIRVMIQRMPLLTLLVTTRQRLGLEGEREIAIAPLPVPPETVSQHRTAVNIAHLMQIESVLLFVDRAQAARPSFEITPSNAYAVAQLCTRLEGLPLAIELCAAWAQTLTPAQMIAQLTRRFDLLVSRRKDIPARHHTLRAALEYGYLLLPTELQQLFVGLSVFRGGWTLDAAAAVCADATEPAEGAGTLCALAAMTELRERSLIVADEKHGGDDFEMRYRMLETLREFAAEQQTLAVEAPLRRRHAEFYLQIARTADAHLAGPEQSAWLRRLEGEHDNLRAALAWAVETGAISFGLRLATALTAFWDIRGYLGEGQDWLGRLLAAPRDTGDDAADVRIRALNAYGRLARGRAEFASAESAVREALHLARDAGDTRGTATSLQLLATLAYAHEDYDGARAYLQEALALARALNDSTLVAGALINVGNVAMELCDWPEAWTRYSEALYLLRSEGDRIRIANALNNLGLVARYQGDYEAARLFLEEDLDISRELASRSGTAIALLNLGTVHRLQGRFSDAETALREAATLAFEMDNKRVLAWCVKERGHLACARQDYRLGIRLLSAAENLRQSLGMSFKPADPDELNRDTAIAKAVMGEVGFTAAWLTGAGLSYSRAYEEALGTPALAIE